MPPKNSSSSAAPNCATKRGSCAQKCCKIHQYEQRLFSPLGGGDRERSERRGSISEFSSGLAFVFQRQRFRPGCCRQRKIRSKAVWRCGQRIREDSTRR